MIKIILIIFLFLFQNACFEKTCHIQTSCDRKKYTEEECRASYKKAKADCEKGKW